MNFNNPIAIRTKLTHIGVCAISVAASVSFSATQDSHDVAQAMDALGLNAQSLACIDVVGSEVGISLDRLQSEFSSYEQLLALQEQIAQNQRVAHESRAVLRDHSDDSDTQLAHDQAEAQIILLSNQASLARVNLIHTVLDGIADSGLISPVIHSQGLYQQLAPEYRLAVESVDEAKLLSWALKMQMIAETNESDLSTDASQAIQNALAQYDVQSAIIRVDTFGDQNQTVIDQWVSTH